MYLTMRCAILFSLLLVLVSPVFIAAAEPSSPLSVKDSSATPVTLPYLLSQDVNHEDYYFSQLIILAMDKSVNEFGAWKKQHHSSWLRDKRLRLALEHGELDVIWSQTNAAFEKDMQAIKFPLLRGLGHYRLLLIREADQALFDKVQSLQQLAKFTGGMGAQWPDVPIMMANNLPQVTVPGFGKLFRMLAAGRFDYFSRGIYQIQSEVDFYPDLPLAIEKHLLLSYPSNFYFFVKKGNEALAQRILIGLKNADADGSFSELFNQVPRYRWAMHELQTSNRLELKLAMPEETP
ncbi:ABC-type amino acid transport substrate-binding protein [Alteromonadaceae bacterium 2753L.S.0a.02]|nr:ABC-type amino acid transport substrate-binding protein [Alteromonadaceae bacterium 2753L.S.0a.02]